jgi:hypothetical protein
MARWWIRYMAGSRIVETVIEADNWPDAVEVAFATIGDPFALLISMRVELPD